VNSNICQIEKREKNQKSAIFFFLDNSAICAGVALPLSTNARALNAATQNSDSDDSLRC
jgi:hypothetical protein